MKDEILRLAKKYNGIITTAQVEKAGFSRVYLKSMVEDGLLTREKQGVYVLPEVINDEYYMFQVKHPKAIFSFETALYLQGVQKEEPTNMNVTVYTGYNTHRFPKDIKNHYIKRELLEDDVIEVKTSYGNTVRCYSAARTICEIIKNEFGEGSSDIAVVALNSYLSSNTYNQKALTECANKMNCYKKLNYTIGVSFLNKKLN